MFRFPVILLFIYDVMFIVSSDRINRYMDRFAKNFCSHLGARRGSSVSSVIFGENKAMNGTV